MFAAIITVSDTCSKGESLDTSGPYLVEALRRTFIGISVCSVIVPDDIEEIQSQLLRFSENEKYDLIITTGGTGFTKRDITPEATLRVVKKLAPGLMTAMCMKSVQITDMAMLSRAVCGIRNETLIINMPGSLKAVTECYQIISNVLPHALNQISGETCLVKITHEQMKSQEISIKELHCCSHKHHDPEKIAFRQRESIYPMLDVEKAKEHILNYVVNMIPCELQDISDARVCMEDIKAPENYPPFRASIKDGYACISSDGKGIRMVKEAVTAGGSLEMSVTSGECIRISTGAMVPSGADCVVQVEDTKLLEHSEDGKVEYKIEIMCAPKPGQDIREIGSDIQKGEKILHKYSLITPGEVGLLKSFGINRVRAVRNITVGVFSTGNEVQTDDSPLRQGCIRDSNGPMLTALIKPYARCEYINVAKDEKQDLLNKLKRGFNTCDIIITSGGVSMGEKDLLKQVLTEDMNMEVVFGRVNMKPGKPTTFACSHDNSKKKAVFALPGNPVSAYVTCNLFVIPALKAMMGAKDTNWPRINVELAHKVTLDARPEYARATFHHVEGKLLPVATVTGNQISSRLTSLVGAQILLELPSSFQKGPVLCKGSTVSALLLRNI